jgi:uncharacterized damage-inducible protein DinB
VRLTTVFDGWQGYQTSLVHAIAPLTPVQLAWKGAEHVRSLGEVIRHLALGRITWLTRMKPPGIDDVTGRVPEWRTDDDGARHVVEEAVGSGNAAVLSEWMEISWRPLEQLLECWTVNDLQETYVHRFRGSDYRVSRQWTIWRILSHDMHHGGQIAMMLSILGAEAFELRALGGHIVAPSKVEPV